MIHASSLQYTYTRNPTNQPIIILSPPPTTLSYRHGHPSAIQPFPANRLKDTGLSYDKRSSLHVYKWYTAIYKSFIDPLGLYYIAEFFPASPRGSPRENRWGYMHDYIRLYIHILVSVYYYYYIFILLSTIVVYILCIVYTLICMQVIRGTE